MMLRDSIAKAKKLFSKTLQSFKAMLSDGYQRLPKAPPFNPFSCGASDSKLHHSFRGVDVLNSNFMDRLGDNPHEEMKRKRAMKKAKERNCRENKEDLYMNGSFMKFARFDPVELRDHHHDHHVRKQEEDQKKTEKGEDDYRVEEEEPSSNSCRVEACYNIAQRLKELEKMDVSSVDHLLDIEEILHYYSRITCPFYVDIVNKFLMEMYAEFLPQTLKGQLG